VCFALFVCGIKGWIWGFSFIVRVLHPFFVFFIGLFGFLFFPFALYSGAQHFQNGTCAWEMLRCSPRPLVWRYTRLYSDAFCGRRGDCPLAPLRKGANSRSRASRTAPLLYNSNWRPRLRHAGYVAL
jgi:hypothetical protein